VNCVLKLAIWNYDRFVRHRIHVRYYDLRRVVRHGGNTKPQPFLFRSQISLVPCFRARLRRIQSVTSLPHIGHQPRHSFRSGEAPGALEQGKIK
jgi:hypothetical protein